MADVRALLAAERASRQIKHPHLSYSKSGALTCNICNLNIKSEQLWPGHQKSSAHRKNLQRTSEHPIRPAKRKIETLEHEAEEQSKKHKSFEGSDPAPDLISDQPLLDVAENKAPDHASVAVEAETYDVSNDMELVEPTPNASVPSATTVNGIDEDEWAAFERDIAPLTRPEYTSATIEAAPVSAAELVEQQKSNPVQQREDEADAEKEEEGRRLEEEFEVMEEMEDRVKRLRERREALRSGNENGLEPKPVQATSHLDPATNMSEAGLSGNENDEDDEDDEDEWYK